MGTATQLADAATPTTFASPWLTQKEAAAYSRKSVRTINEALRAGTLVGHQSKVGGNWTVHVNELDAWVRAGSPTGSSRRAR